MKNKFKLSEANVREFAGGTLVSANKQNFGVLEKLSIQSIELLPGALREPHIHPNAAQLDYCVAGKAQIGIVGSDGQKQLFDLDAGDISFVPQGHLHWIKNHGDSNLHMILITSHESPETIEMSEILAGVPKNDLATIFGVNQNIFEQIPQRSKAVNTGKKN